MSKNLTNAARSLAAELEAGHVEQEDVAAYLENVDQVIEQARAVRALYKREMAVVSSRKSRQKRADEVAAMKARLAELEAADK